MGQQLVGGNGKDSPPLKKGDAALVVVGAGARAGNPGGVRWRGMEVGGINPGPAISLGAYVAYMGGLGTEPSVFGGLVA